MFGWLLTLADEIKINRERKVEQSIVDAAREFERDPCIPLLEHKIQCAESEDVRAVYQSILLTYRSWSARNPDIVNKASTPRECYLFLSATTSAQNLAEKHD